LDKSYSRHTRTHACAVRPDAKGALWFGQRDTTMAFVHGATLAIAARVSPRPGARDDRAHPLRAIAETPRACRDVAATLSCGGRAGGDTNVCRMSASALSSRVSPNMRKARHPGNGARRGQTHRCIKTTFVFASATGSDSSNASSSKTPTPKKLRVAISGASGFVGTRLVATLLHGGNDVVVLTRDVDKARNALRNSFSGGTIAFADPSKWAAAIVGCDGVVNLAGEPISTRWSPRIKAEIMASRIKATKRIADAIAACPVAKRPSALVNASAIGFYGTSTSKTFDENSPPGGDYLSRVCQAWEAQAVELRATAPATRVVLLRLGIVLDRDGGALGKMLPTFKVFAGGPMGDGAQWFSWIHREDAVGIILESLVNPGIEGPVNVTSPNPVRMAEMCSALGRTLGRPNWLPVPDFAIQALLGEGATVVLQGQKVEPSAALKAGYEFKFEKLEDALGDILR